MNNPVFCGLVCAAVLAAGGHAGADTVVITASRDNTLFAIDPLASNGSGPSVFCGRTGAGGGSTVQRALVFFRVAGNLPAGSTITSATLTLTLEQASPFADEDTLTLHRVESDWGEGLSQGFGGTGAPPEPGDATWLHTFYPDELWAVAGGDFNATPSGSTAVINLPGPYVWASTAPMVADVQGWLDDPQTAHGWMVRGNEAIDFTARRFASREGAPDQAPRLTVEFTPPACPADCGDGDGEVAIVDFLAVLGQWGLIGESCDMGLGPQGVGIEEFNAVLGLWGPCPP